MTDIWAALQALQGPAALATVVRVSGSAYRHEGAKLLIPAGGAPRGMISGGCLEADVAAQAGDVITTGRPAMLTYDMRSEADDGLWGLNLGCNGKIEILLERAEPSLLGAIAAEWEAGRPCTALTVVTEGERLGARMLIHADGSIAGSLGDPGLEADALTQVRGAARPKVINVRDVEIFVDRITPPPTLWVVGAGSDAPALVQAASFAGWRVNVADHRAAYADPARFPQARRVVCVEPEELARQAGPGAFAVLMNHHFDHDRAFLLALLGAAPRYIGVLGPLRRTLRMLDGAPLPDCVHAPVGLDLGGDGPEAVAISIVAELQAVRHGRPGSPLRGSGAPLHNR